LIPNFINS